MHDSFQPMDEARQIMAWRYEQPHAVYNWEDGDEPDELRLPFLAVLMDFHKLPW